LEDLEALKMPPIKALVKSIEANHTVRFLTKAEGLVALWNLLEKHHNPIAIAENKRAEKLAMREAREAEKATKARARELRQQDREAKAVEVKVTTAVGQADAIATEVLEAVQDILGKYGLSLPAAHAPKRRARAPKTEGDTPRPGIFDVTTKVGTPSTDPTKRDRNGPFSIAP
jgi:hypothetical protein